MIRTAVRKKRLTIVIVALGQLNVGRHQLLGDFIGADYRLKRRVPIYRGTSEKSVKLHERVSEP